ncbi:MAG: hypothetical protein EPO06_10870 [Burkholderiaceae bacterium]|nr:MAG: hypothetical protein EPO06_10870 [Burkholderiaceae bacterium]
MVQVAEPAPPPAAADGVTPVLATINWLNPENPVAIPLSWRGTRFLLETQDGLQIWDSDTLQKIPLQHPVADGRLLEHIWMRTEQPLQHGTLFAVSSADASAPAATLYWIDNGQTKIGKRLDLPAGFMPSTLVAVTGDTALLCAAKSQRALLVSLGSGELKQLTAAGTSALHASLLTEMQKMGIVGPLEGIGELVETPGINHSTDTRPLVLNTRGCTWSARKLPEPLASARNLEILPVMLGSFSRPGIVAASWLEPGSNAPRTLQTPLVWDGESQQWQARQTGDFSGIAPQRLAGVRAEQWVYGVDLAEGRFAFLAQVEERWREATQRLPAAEGIKLLPIGNEGVLALLIDSRQPGRIVRLDPAPEHWLAARFRGSVSPNDAAIPFNGGAMIVESSKSSHVTLIKPDDSNPTQLPDLPYPQSKVSGTQLGDGSVVVFGGQINDCAYTHPCPQAPLPSFRWIPTENRWQPLTALAVQFAAGEPFDEGASRRSDFVLHGGKEIFYLSSNELQSDNDTKAQPTVLFHWQLGGATQSLAATRISRANATLIELDDGRFAVMGGAAANEPPTPACSACQSKRQAEVRRLRDKLAHARRTGENSAEEEEDEDPEQQVPPCAACEILERNKYMSFSRSCEIYDPRSERWSWGPSPVHPAGRAVKLANGRIFKLGLLGYNSTDAEYAAETADARLSQWVAAPSFPLGRSTVINDFFAIGNQVLVVLSKPADRYVLWDDASQSWQVLPLPRHADWGLRDIPVHVGVAGEGKLLMIYPRSFEYLAWPFQ